MCCCKVIVAVVLLQSISSGISSIWCVVAKYQLYCYKVSGILLQNVRCVLQRIWCIITSDVVFHCHDYDDPDPPLQSSWSPGVQLQFSLLCLLKNTVNGHMQLKLAQNR